MVAGIPISALPLTLRQAVWVTHCLDISYICIDALCIIQDDRSDWTTEAAKMAAVYTMSALTIIAASSTSCHSGFFPTQLDAFSTQVQTSLPPTISLHATKHAPGRGGFHDYPSSDPIGTRGWTYQEEYLSTRYLRFTAADVQWKCHAGATCLCSGEPPHMWYTAEWAMFDWLFSVLNISRRHFTNETDKLPSLSGLATRFAAELRERREPPSAYVAGLWEAGNRNIQDLEWCVEDWNSDSDRDSALFCCGPGPCPETYIAPSFVWASVNNPIDYRRAGCDERQKLSEVIQVHA